MNRGKIVITTADLQCLRDITREMERWCSKADRHSLARLKQELEQAVVVEPADVPPDVVTVNTRVRFRDLDNNEEMDYTLVLPDKANLDKKCLSVMAPLGMALLGYRTGEVIEWPVPAGTRRLRIEQVLYQPEAAGTVEP
jgi:regulator of nucleoside diphosphate kinase